MYNVFDDMMMGMVSVLGDVGFDDQENVSFITKGINGRALATLQEFDYFSDADMLKEASTAIASGSMMGLGGMFEGQTDAMAAMMQDISAASMKQLYDVAQYMDLGSEFGNIAAGYSSGMVKGLAYADWSATAIAGFQGNIVAGFQTGMTGTIADMSQYTTMINGSITGTINEFSTMCQNEGGTWDDTMKLCNWPVYTAAANATLPTDEEWNNCVNNIGGMIAYLADGTWFCSTNAGAMNDPAAMASCMAMGNYYWMNGMCLPMPTTGAQCYNAADEGSCQNIAGCMWDGAYCYTSSQVSCATSFTSEGCSLIDGCMWKTDAATGFSYCTNYSNIGCGVYINKEPCESNTGCAWNTTVAPINTCLPATQVQCSSFTSSGTCSSPCTWIDTFPAYCTNATTTSCSARDINSCTGECFWAVNTGCINTSSAPCSVFPMANCPTPRCSTTVTPGFCSASPVCSTLEYSDCIAQSTSCAWTGITNGCLSISAVTCTNFDFSLCPTGANPWGNCKAVGGVYCLPSCTGLDQASCTARSTDCTWMPTSGPCIDN